MTRQPAAMPQSRAGRGGIERPCHLKEMFITSSGDVFPCCLTWNRPEMKIGHIADPDIDARIAAFDATCRCSSFAFRKATHGDVQDYKLNIEFSLICNGECAMCCVDAPARQRPYAYYDELQRFADSLPSINHMVAQGGEVLIQKKTLDWIRTFRREKPEIPIGIITNGNVAPGMASEVETLFDNVLISFYGFQPETYTRISGLSLETARRFAGEIVARKKTTVHLKYLITPLNIHEANLFLQWAVNLGPETISIIDSWIPQYINRDTSDGYWDKIIERTGEAVRGVISASSEKIRSRGIVILIDAMARTMFGIEDSFINETGLAGRILPNPMVG